MLEKCRNAQERWGGVSDIIDNWLDGRQKLISFFVSLPQQNVQETLNDKIQEFCQLMMDYISSGHFEVYEQLLKQGSEFNDGSLEKAQALFPNIQNSTDAALDFNDIYSSFEGITLQEMYELTCQLSSLGETLEERFALEDKMIEILHIAHRERVFAEPQA
ncbi:sigma D regulator [Amphritea sp. 2_MG-2023]|jgi:regulator of sigma D|uniref:sigma D regulator n=1 Tax=Amphritea TaxID=515417 RepID=UPI001C06BAFB|nr:MULTISPECIES: sigma D regulator [Amphritea]MBU2967111.1 sigma D regulator [Amphritea atlantica]MDO6419336.1 sigma D regulator [Amphritea sp. 2_MG-2023]MDX2421729.1 sigma D regulator [Amphritea sp.]